MPHLAVFLLSLAGTWLIRHFALRVKLLDVPNHRSSHEQPVPRGGGLAILTVFSIALLFLKAAGQMTSIEWAAFFIPGILVGVLGFIDDWQSLSSRWRLLFHILAAGIGLYFLKGMPAISLPYGNIPAGLPADLFAMLYITWFINLYNFMDGIDGIAASEAVFMGMGAALIYGITGFSEAALLPLLFAASAAGFLFWNFPPARIFMGDCGSGFLGLVAALLSVRAAHLDIAFFWMWLILSGVFIVDTTVTLFVRAFAGERLSEAHCSHAYQHAARSYGAHRAVTVRVLLINCFWLWPLALLVASHQMDGFWGVCLAYSALLVLVLKFQAGRAANISKA